MAVEPRATTDAERWFRERFARAPQREALFSTLSGEPVEPLYTAEDLPGPERIGFPGEFPFTRGVYPSMYRGRLWTMRQFAGFGTAEETNERFRYLLEHGQTGLSTAFDMPSLMGHDSDDRRSLGEVGREGVAVDTLDDMQDLFAGIDLGEVTVSMTINAPAAMAMAFYVVAAEEGGVPRDRLGGTVQADILKEYIAQKEWCFPVDPAMRLLGDLIEWCSKEMPRWHPVSISGYHIREAGSTAAQELAFTLKDGLTYVQQAVDRGLDVDDFAPRLSFFFNAQIDFFEEIAKYRAARRIWARELRTEDAVRVALRTQQVIAHETGVTNTIDPLGGSYFVEALTDEMERACYEYFARIDELGGVVEAIKRGFPQREIADAAFRYQREVDAGERIVVGVNDYRLEGEAEIPILRIDPELERKQARRLAATKERRDSAAVERTLGAVKEAAATDRNLMEPIIEAARARASEGEMVAAMQEVFGTFTEQPQF